MSQLELLGLDPGFTLESIRVQELVAENVVGLLVGDHELSLGKTSIR
jgi:hypothetical protein